MPRPDHELVVRRNGTVYVRRVPYGRSFEDATENRKKALLQFTRSAISGRGRNLEQFISHMRAGIRPVGRTARYRDIELSEADIENIRDAIARNNISSFDFPASHVITVKPELKALVEELKIEKAISETKPISV